MPVKSYSTRKQKVEWLLRHLIFLVGKQNNKKIVTAMKRDGLVAPSTYWPDIQTGINEAVREAKLRWYAEHNGREPNVYDA